MWYVYAARQDSWYEINDKGHDEFAMTLPAKLEQEVSVGIEFLYIRILIICDKNTAVIRDIGLNDPCKLTFIRTFFAKGK